VKRLISILVFVLCTILTGWAQAGSDSIKQGLNVFLDQWHLDAAQSKLSEYIGAMSANGVFLGTDPAEYWTVPEFDSFCRPYFERKSTWTFKAVSRNIYLSKDAGIAWFDELLMTRMGLCRGSGVISKQGNRWLIEQYVLSPTIPNDLMKNVTRMKGVEDTILMMKSIFDKYGLKGTMIIYDPHTNRYFGHNPALWDSAYLPASTFKIPNSLIGLETGVVDTAVVFKWDGKKRSLPQWERDLTLREAFSVSCVPCFQEVARKIGPERMREYLVRLQYGQMDVNSSDIDVFWLEGNSGITPRQQVGFLQRLHDGKLPLKQSTMAAVKSIMLIEKTQDYSLCGKTGWAIRNGRNYGWFVGYIESGSNVYYLATLVMPKNQEKPSDFAIARKTVTMEILRFLSVVP